MSSMIAQYTSSSGPFSTSNSTALAHHTSEHHKSGKTKTKTKTVTEDCDDDDNESITTSVEVSSSPVTITAPETVTMTVTIIDFESTKSLYKPKHTKHTLTESEIETVESTSPTVTESSETSTKHHKSKHHKSKHSKSKHHKSKHHKSKHSSSETVEETPVPTSVQSSSQSLSQSASDTSKEEVVVVTTEEVEVVTTGVEEIVSTITLSEGDTTLSTLTQASSTESLTVAPWRTSSSLNPLIDPTWPYRIWPTETHSYALSTETRSPFIPLTPKILLTPTDWWFTSTKTESPAEETTPPTRSGHKTKEPPSIFSEVYGLTSDSSKETLHLSIPTEGPLQVRLNSTFIYSMEDPISTITTAPEYPPPVTWSAEDATETLVARDVAGGDPRKKHDKMLKPDKAMSKRMSRWSKHHSHLLEKSWSYHTKHELKSLEQQMEYDAKHSKKHHHHTTDVAVLPAASADAALAPRNEEAVHTDDPEKDFQRKMSVANKVHNKFSSQAERAFQEQKSKADKKASKKRAKSMAKQNKKDEKSRNKAMKSRIKHHKGGDDDYEEEEDYGDEDFVVWADVAPPVTTTPKTGVPARATVTTMVTTVVGGLAGNGTLSTSWRVHHASQTASASTAGW